MKTKAVHIKHGGSEMRRLSARFVAAIVMLGGLWLFSSPAPLFAQGLPNDGNPHYAQNQVCVNHVTNPQPIGTTTPQIFTMCQVTSGATSWYATITPKFSTTPVCTFGSKNAPVTATSPQTFPCTITTNGSYKGTIFFYVGPSQLMTTYDYYFTVP